MGDTTLGLRKGRIESMGPGQGCRKLQRSLPTGANFPAVFPV